MPVSFHSLINSFKLTQQKRISNWILLVMFREEKEVEKIDFIFCSNPYILKLNKKFLFHHSSTDVITFDYSKNNKSVFAEIFISVDEVKKNARYYRVSFMDELHRVMIHGVLHCCGYSDKNVSDRKKMHIKENELLNLLLEME
ncbi:MAG: rRNA maturation RNase YbeY [Chitinophagales bacterium]